MRDEEAVSHEARLLTPDELREFEKRKNEAPPVPLDAKWIVSDDGSQSFLDLEQVPQEDAP